MEVLINNRQKKIRLNTRRIRLIAEEIMRFEGLPDRTELSLVFCDDDFIQKLNHQHLGRDEPTDVLSFPLEEDDFEHGDRLIGDIVISVETACRQAQKLRHSVGLEIVFLLIHGLLHLEHYDHQRREDLKRMRDREMTIFSHLSEKKLLKGIEAGPQASLIARTQRRSTSTTSQPGAEDEEGTKRRAVKRRAGGAARSAGTRPRSRKPSPTEN